MNKNNLEIKALSGLYINTPTVKCYVSKQTSSDVFGCASKSVILVGRSIENENLQCDQAGSSSAKNKRWDMLGGGGCRGRMVRRG